ncbi:MAG: hypothetical protein KIT27_05455 [Legionellales bacterium]|nr:hypothetical protein [Legionellales bacterium]
MKNVNHFSQFSASNQKNPSDIPQLFCFDEEFLCIENKNSFNIIPPYYEELSNTENK